MGRILLADLPSDRLHAHLPPEPWPELTPRTLTRRSDLLAELDRVRDQGWAMVDQELEEGVRSIAAPLRDRSGRAVAGLNVSSHAGRISLDVLCGEFLPQLLATAERISDRLARR
jgi:IclR family pca regulon transcriptional regulator